MKKIQISPSILNKVVQRKALLSVNKAKKNQIKIATSNIIKLIEFFKFSVASG